MDNIDQTKLRILESHLRYIQNKIDQIANAIKQNERKIGLFSELSDLNKIKEFYINIGSILSKNTKDSIPIVNEMNRIFFTISPIEKSNKQYDLIHQHIKSISEKLRHIDQIYQDMTKGIIEFAKAKTSHSIINVSLNSIYKSSNIIENNIKEIREQEVKKTKRLFFSQNN